MKKYTTKQLTIEAWQNDSGMDLLASEYDEVIPQDHYVLKININGREQLYFWGSEFFESIFEEFKEEAISSIVGSRIRVKCPECGEERTLAYIGGRDHEKTGEKRCRACSNKHKITRQRTEEKNKLIGRIKVFARECLKANNVPDARYGGLKYIATKGEAIHSYVDQRIDEDIPYRLLLLAMREDPTIRNVHKAKSLFVYDVNSGA